VRQVVILTDRCALPRLTRLSGIYELDFQHNNSIAICQFIAHAGRQRGLPTKMEFRARYMEHGIYKIRRRFIQNLSFSLSHSLSLSSSSSSTLNRLNCGSGTCSLNLGRLAYNNLATTAHKLYPQGRLCRKPVPVLDPFKELLHLGGAAAVLGAWW